MLWPANTMSALTRSVPTPVTVAAASNWRGALNTSVAPLAIANDPVSGAPLLCARRRRSPGPVMTAPLLLNGVSMTDGGPAAPVRLKVPPARLLKRLFAAPTQSLIRPLLLVPLLMADTVNVDLLFTTVPSPMQMLPTDH